MTIRLDERGGGSAVATEELAGWPALEWAELVDRFGADRVRLREDFEQRWLGVQFPGARLRDLEVDLPRDASGRVGTARACATRSSARTWRCRSTGQPEIGGASARCASRRPSSARSPGAASPPSRSATTALMLGFDVPIRMTATVELPGAAAVRRAPERPTIWWSPAPAATASSRTRGRRAGAPERHRAAPRVDAAASCASPPGSTRAWPPICGASTAPSRRRSGSGCGAAGRGAGGR